MISWRCDLLRSNQAKKLLKQMEYNYNQGCTRIVTPRSTEIVVSRNPSLDTPQQQKSTACLPTKIETKKRCGCSYCGFYSIWIKPSNFDSCIFGSQWWFSHLQGAIPAIRPVIAKWMDAAVDDRLGNLKTKSLQLAFLAENHGRFCRIFCMLLLMESFGNSCE